MVATARSIENITFLGSMSSAVANASAASAYRPAPESIHPIAAARHHHLVCAVAPVLIHLGWVGGVRVCVAGLAQGG